MTDSSGAAPNGAAPAPQPIRFGDLPIQTMHPDTAAGMLRLLFENEPGTFARLHLAVLTGGDKYTITVRRRDAGAAK